MKFIVSLLIIGCSVAIAFALYANKPVSRKSTPRQPVPVVKAIPLEKKSERIFVEAFGSVIPARSVSLQPEVEGKIIAVNPSLIPGGIVEKGELLVELDSIDYQLLATELKADVARAEYELELERGQQVIARKEWQLLENNIEITEKGKSLALREPHLRQAQMRLAAAKSKLTAAQLDIERCRITSPFHGLILSENVDIGQLVSRQSTMVELVDVDEFWVLVSLSPSHLQTLLKNGGIKKVETEIIWDQSGSELVTRTGIVKRLQGELDEKGKMAKVLVTLPDPLNLTGNKEGIILLGSFVTVRIDAGMLDNIYVIPREAVNDDNLWFVSGDSELVNVDFTVRWRREGELLISGDIPPNFRLVTSRIHSPLPGMRVLVDTRTIEGAQQSK